MSVLSKVFTLRLGRGPAVAGRDGGGPGALSLVVTCGAEVCDACRRAWRWCGAVMVIVVTCDDEVVSRVALVGPWR